MQELSRFVVTAFQHFRTRTKLTQIEIMPASKVMPAPGDAAAPNPKKLTKLWQTLEPLMTEAESPATIRTASHIAERRVRLRVRLCECAVPLVCSCSHIQFLRFV